MLSRVAENFYWMGRYIERACNTARFLEVNYNLSLDLDSQYVQWEPLVHITGDYEYFLEKVGDFSEEKVMDFLVHDQSYWNSVISGVRMARENAQSIREFLPSEFYEVINDAYAYLNRVSGVGEITVDRAYAACQRIKTMGMNLVGIGEDLSWHGEGFHFYQIGKWLERADKVSRILHAKYFYLLPSTREVGSAVDDIHWSALLRSINAFDLYHRHYGLISPERIISLMVLEENFPRSIRYSLEQAYLSLQNVLKNQDEEQSLYRLAELVEFIRAEEPTNIIKEGLHEYVNDLQIKLNKVSDAITLDFF